MLSIFNDILERNNAYSETLDFRRCWVGEVGVVTFFILEVPDVPDYKSAMLLYSYICIRLRDTSRSFEPIFMKSTWLVRVHPRVNPIGFGNNRPNRSTDMGENVPLKPIFWIKFGRYGFSWGKNLKIVFSTPLSTEKIIFIFVVRRPVPSKKVCPLKIIFRGYFGKYCVFFFFKKNCTKHI